MTDYSITREMHDSAGSLNHEYFVRRNKVIALSLVPSVLPKQSNEQAILNK